ncbi:MAG: hypothetical protein CMJ05_08415 [Pelagibacterales bacterium]|nr:hypothetical protein [Pelagibacterales bacterium]
MIRLLILMLITTICYSQQVDIKMVYPLASVESPPVFDNCLNVIDKDKKKCFEQTVKNHIQRNIRYPDDAYNLRKDGKVLVGFIINRSGMVSKIITRGSNKLLNNEVERVIKLLSISKPAKIKGVQVAVNYALPVNFYLLSQSNNSLITIADGANIYESPDSKSKQLFYTRYESKFNARKEGGFWLVEFDKDGILLGYVSDEDVLSIDQYNSNDKELNQTKSINNQIRIDKPLIEKKEKIQNYSPIKITQEDESNKDNLLITEEDILIREYEADKLKLASFIQKLEKQKETDRLIPGINKSDLYYGNALKELIKILEKEIETKYLTLSTSNPDVFYNTDFDIRKRSNKKKANKLINKTQTISYDFIKQNFYSFPSINDTKRFNELITELDNLEYIEIENPSSDKLLRRVEQFKLAEDPFVQSKPNISNKNKKITDIQINSPTELYVIKNVVNDYGISGLRRETNEVYQKIQNTLDKRNIKTTIVKPSQENIVEKNNDQKIDKNIKNLDKLPINIPNNLPNETLDVESAKKRLKDLFFLFSQDLISKEIYEEFALELRQIIDSEEKKNITSNSNLKISSKEALERIRSLRSFLDQGLISKETYNEAVKVLKDIATNIEEN